MLFKEINRIYTEKIKEYFNAGYTINAGTMSGSEGEIAAIDLTRENDSTLIIRIYMEEFYCYGEMPYLRGIRIVTGSVTDPIDANLDKRMSNTIWNNRLKAIDEVRFYKIGEDKVGGKTWYGTFEEAKAAQEKAFDRFKIDSAIGDGKHTFPISSHKIILPLIKKQKGFKSARLSDVDEVYGETIYNPLNGKTSKRYYARVRNMKLRLR